MNQTPKQSNQSIEQQQRLLAMFIDAVNAYLAEPKALVPHVFALGYPGTDKPTAPLNALTKAFSKDLNCVV